MSRQDLTLKPRAALLYGIVCPVICFEAIESRCKHDMDALSWLSVETLERAVTPLIHKLVRCSAHGCSFARLQYWNQRAATYWLIDGCCVDSLMAHFKTSILLRIWATLTRYTYKYKQAATLYQKDMLLLIKLFSGCAFISQHHSGRGWQLVCSRIMSRACDSPVVVGWDTAWWIHGLNWLVWGRQWLTSAAIGGKIYWLILYLLCMCNWWYLLKGVKVHLMWWWRLKSVSW